MIMSVPPPVRGELVMYQPSNLFPVYYIWCDPGKVYLYLGTVSHVSCSIYISIHVPLYYLPVPKCANVHAFKRPNVTEEQTRRTDGRPRV